MRGFCYATLSASRSFVWGGVGRWDCALVWGAQRLHHACSVILFGCALLRFIAPRGRCVGVCRSCECGGIRETLEGYMYMHVIILNALAIWTFEWWWSEVKPMKTRVDPELIQLQLGITVAITDPLTENEHRNPPTSILEQQSRPLGRGPCLGRGLYA